MTVEEIFSKILSHMAKGLVIHDQMSVIYCFLNLKGYQKRQEYQYYEESRNYKKLHNYYLNHFYKMIPDLPFEKPNLIPNNWYKHTKMDVDTNTKRSTVRDLMKEWVNWETETKNQLQKFYKELNDMGESAAASKIKYFLKDVDKELKSAYKEYLKLEAVGYDIIFISDEQDSLYHKYKKE